MKSIIWAILVTLFAQPSFALDADFLGYLRGGSGLNLQGGQRECFYNQGLPGNFLRLGNECDFYTELAMVFNHKKATADDPVFFRTQVRFAYSSKGLRQWESTVSSVNGSPGTVKLPNNEIEAYVKAGGFSEVPGEFWVGKRFYRDVDLHIFDWYYYADMSGVGAGVEALSVGPGQLAIAHMIQSNEDLNSTSVGRPVLNVLDLRYTSVPVGSQKINFWTAYAWAPGSTQGTTQYNPTNGYAIASRLEGPAFTGHNNVALLFGQGAMKDFNIYGNSAVPATDTSQNRAWNVRLVNDWNRDVTDYWAIMFGVAANYGSNGKDSKNIVQWQEIGIRPIYFVTDRFQWVFETGYSHYKDESETLTNGQPAGDRELGRVTVAPQLSMSKSMWGRPVLRAFASYSFWNSNNEDPKYIGASAPTFANKSSGMSFGYQFEAWF
ncbi:carbohydrate porin [Bdellovibrio svalbardensis]|uniref:Carbohydrate porin n=1 Tax=Bdellovibrio svalbardensis TaxID=2972972 RepID=A0ABT6DKY3_9BACT|nr:carbohydrate porin [Bdellovibrio svalbardensis]MDG0817224.1 carbohydrate porin [Bdellovibrio svalbardensis]